MMKKLFKILGLPTKEEIVLAIADEVASRIHGEVLQPLIAELEKQVKQLEANVSEEVRAEVKNIKKGIKELGKMINFSSTKKVEEKVNGILKGIEKVMK